MFFSLRIYAQQVKPQQKEAKETAMMQACMSMMSNGSSDSKMEKTDGMGNCCMKMMGNMKSNPKGHQMDGPDKQGKQGDTSSKENSDEANQNQ